VGSNPTLSAKTLIPTFMATVYELKVKTVSPFVNYDEKTITKLLEDFIDSYRHPETGMRLESTKVTVIKRS
jgi:hypothetical protein